MREGERERRGGAEVLLLPSLSSAHRPAIFMPSALYGVCARLRADSKRKKKSNSASHVHTECKGRVPSVTISAHNVPPKISHSKNISNLPPSPSLHHSLSLPLSIFLILHPSLSCSTLQTHPLNMQVVPTTQGKYI